MKAFSKTTVLLLSVLACGAAQAAESVDVTVAGRLAPVNSCVPTLSSSALNYGVIKASELNRDKQTILPEKMITLTVDCRSWVNSLQVSFPDSKAADAIRDPRVIKHPLCPPDKNGCANFAFGLGRDGQDRKLGALFLRTAGATIDGKPARWHLVAGPLEGDRGTKVPDTLFTPRERPNEGTFAYGYMPLVEDCQPSGDGMNCYQGQHFSIPIGINPIIDSKDRAIADDVKLDGAFSIEIRTL